MRIYEQLFILKPDATEEEINAVIQQLEGVVTSAGGTIEKTEKWGLKKLAYKVNKKAEGFYVLMVFHAKPETVKEVERRMRVADSVMKYLTVRMDEKLKWLEKRKKARAERAARKPAPVVPAPAAPGAAPVAPGAPAAAGAPAPGAPAPAVPAAPAPAAPVEAAAATPSPEAAS